MKEEEIREELLDLEAKIAKLPKGYISKKCIRGKIKYYLQWVEEGEKKSKYIDENLMKSLLPLIEERRTLQEKVKKLKNQLPQGKRENDLSFKTNVIIKDQLRLFANSVKLYKKRDCFKQIQDYLYSDIQDKVLILYGLRRTGKTTLMKQAILSMSSSDFERCAYIDIRNGNNLTQMNEDLKKLLNLGYKYIFIDEVTRMDDFIEGAALFSDVFASCNMKIILTGTDSLGFMFAQDEQLYDRTILIHTTFIPYHEFEKVLGIKGIDEYIRLGGTMSLGGIHYNYSNPFDSKKSTDEYIDSAIAKNIQHSLKCYQYEEHFRALKDLYEHDELTSSVNRIIEDMNHRFALEVLTRDFISHDLGISAKNLRSDKLNPTDVLDHINKEEVTKRIKKSLEIKNKDEQIVPLLKIHQEEIKEYLDLLDLTLDLEIKSIPISSKLQYRTLFSQPGMRYAQAKALIQALMQDELFMNIPIKERTRIKDRILDGIQGRMIEDIILLETKIAKPTKEVLKLQFAVGEFDMVILDSSFQTCEVYEIKHSKEVDEKQYKNLIDEKKCKDVEFYFGKIIKKCVLYRGNDTFIGKIEYKNIEEYLCELI